MDHVWIVRRYKQVSISVYPGYRFSFNFPSAPEKERATAFLIDRKQGVYS